MTHLVNVKGNQLAGTLTLLKIPTHTWFAHVTIQCILAQVLCYTIVRNARLIVAIQVREEPSS